MKFEKGEKVLFNGDETYPHTKGYYGVVVGYNENVYTCKVYNSNNNCVTAKYEISEEYVMSYSERPPSIFFREYKNEDGSVERWYYDLEKHPNGPIDVQIDYPKGYMNYSEKLEEEQKNLPPTQKLYMNDATGEYVGYGRAKQLGII